MRITVVLLVLGMVLACMTATAIEGDGPETREHNPDAPHANGQDDDKPANNGESWDYGEEPEPEV